MTAPGSRRAEATPRRARPLLVCLLVLLVVAIAAGGFLLLRGDDDPQRSDRPAGTLSPGGTTEADPRDDPLDDPLSHESIDLRYAALAGAVTTDAGACRRGKVRSGQDERVLCETPVGELELVTYTSAKDLATRRDRAVTDEPGGVLDTDPAGTLFAFGAPAPETGKAGGKKAPELATFLYWDDDASLRSATYTASAGIELDGLVAAYGATGPTRPYPTGPGTKVLAFAQRWAGADDCVRTVTVNAGALEESYCDVAGPVEVFLGRFATLDELKAYRKVLVASAIADERDLREWKRGALYEYKTDDGTVARYWDDPGCLCYAEAFRAKGTYAQLATWWDQK